MIFDECCSQKGLMAHNPLRLIHNDGWSHGQYYTAGVQFH